MNNKDVKNAAGAEAFAADNESSEAMNINADSDVPGTAYMNEAINESSETEKLQAEIAGLKDKYLRQVAEFDNFRKRSARESLELRQTAGRDIITSLLDVLDDCDRAQKQLETSNDVTAIREGVLLVFNKLRKTVQSKGVKVMETLQQDFNPDMPEAITEIPAPTKALVGKVLDEVQKGYYMNDKIIRFAQVVVGK